MIKIISKHQPMGTKSTTALKEESRKTERACFLTNDQANKLSSEIYHFLQVKTQKEIIISKRDSLKQDGLCRISVSFLPIPEREEQEKIFTCLDEFVKKINSKFFIERTKHLTVLYLNQL